MKRKLIFWLLHGFIILQISDVSSFDKELWTFDSCTVNFGNVIFYLFQLLLGENAEVPWQLSFCSTLLIAWVFLKWILKCLQERYIFCPANPTLISIMWMSQKNAFNGLGSSIWDAFFSSTLFVLSPSAAICSWTASSQCREIVLKVNKCRWTLSGKYFWGQYTMICIAGCWQFDRLYVYTHFKAAIGEKLL